VVRGLEENGFTVEISRDQIVLSGEEAAGVSFRDLCFVGAIITANSETMSVQIRQTLGTGSQFWFRNQAYFYE
jgi:hypothetical protein